MADIIVAKSIFNIQCGQHWFSEHQQQQKCGLHFSKLHECVMVCDSNSRSSFSASIKLFQRRVTPIKLHLCVRWLIAKDDGMFLLSIHSSDLLVHTHESSDLKDSESVLMLRAWLCSSPVISVFVAGFWLKCFPSWSLRRNWLSSLICCHGNWSRNASVLHLRLIVLPKQTCTLSDSH